MNHPPFCPNLDCRNHQLTKKTNGWFQRNGFYTSRTHGKTRRFRCIHCGNQFSEQTFRLTYRTRRKIYLPFVFNQIKSAAGIRDIARDYKVSPTTITNRISRLARQAIAIHSNLRSRICLQEDLVADGFESFSVSQYFPNNIHILGGKQSQYLYTFDYAYIRRKGRMTEYQEKRNSILKLKTQTGNTITSSFACICGTINELLSNSILPGIRLHTDEKKEYKQITSVYPFQKPLEHLQYSSKLYRNLNNHLFTVNYIERQIRKDCAEHVRETVQHSRNVNNSMERLALYRMYHNYIKPYRINRKKGIPKDATHAEMAGIDRKSIKHELRTFYTRRRFLFRLDSIVKEDLMILLRALATPLKKHAEPVGSYAA